MQFELFFSASAVSKDSCSFFMIVVFLGKVYTNV